MSRNFDALNNMKSTSNPPTELYIGTHWIDTSHKKYFYHKVYNGKKWNILYRIKKEIIESLRLLLGYIKT